MWRISFQEIWRCFIGWLQFFCSNVQLLIIVPQAVTKVLWRSNCHSPNGIWPKCNKEFNKDSPNKRAHLHAIEWTILPWNELYKCWGQNTYGFALLYKSSKSHTAKIKLIRALWKQKGSRSKNHSRITGLVPPFCCWSFVILLPQEWERNLAQRAE